MYKSGDDKRIRVFAYHYCGPDLNWMLHVRLILVVCFSCTGEFFSGSLVFFLGGGEGGGGVCQVVL